MQNIRSPLPDSLLSSLSDFLAAQTGLYFPKKRWGDLERGIVAAARQFGLPDAQACAHRLLSAPLTRSQIETLASHLTVGETYFFREKRSFEALEQYILPALLHAREHTERRLRIWSAGCCTGEEAYSIAMLLDQLIPDPEKWNVTILATDINPAFLGKAAAGDVRRMVIPRHAGLDPGASFQTWKKYALRDPAAHSQAGDIFLP